MHIEFMLPTGAGGQSALYYNTVLDQHLVEWSQYYHCTYTKTLTYYRASIQLNSEQAYTLFALTWTWSTPKWIIKED
jgi:hypothetical protein